MERQENILCLGVFLPLTASSPLGCLRCYWILRLSASQHLFTRLSTHILPVLTHTCAEGVLTFPRLGGWRCVVIVWKEANRVKIWPGSAPTHRDSVGYRSRDLSAPSLTTAPVVVKLLRCRTDRKELSENPCGKEGQSQTKSKDPWQGLNGGEVLIITTSAAALTVSCRWKWNNKSRVNSFDATQMSNNEWIINSNRKTTSRPLL